MTTPNWKNRTMWTGDNLDVMRGLNSETVDLIYLDPPFNSNRDYAAPIGSKAAGAAFKDTWTLSDVDEAWHGEIAESQPALYSIVDAAGLAHGKGMKAYLVMMAVRLLEMRRLLKPTGSIYLHCDPTASHYLKLLMDTTFGETTFKTNWPGSEPARTATRSDTQAFRTACSFMLSRGPPGIRNTCPSGKPTLNGTTGTQIKSAATVWTILPAPDCRTENPGSHGKGTIPAKAGDIGVLRKREVMPSGSRTI